MIKMVATDLDGTLLRRESHLSDYTKDVLNRCRQKGIKTIFASGRGESTKNQIPEDMFNGRVLMNGSLAYDGEELIYERIMPIDEIRNLLIALDKRGLKTSVVNGKTHYSNFAVNDVWAYLNHFEMVDFSAFPKDAQKLYTLVNNEEEIVFVKENLPENLYMVVSNGNFIQFMHKEASKSLATRVLAKRWGIDMSEVVCFGDDTNDIDMFENCGTAVAMENAVSEVKELASHICKSNNEDGVAKWLEENCL